MNIKETAAIIDSSSQQSENSGERKCDVGCDHSGVWYRTA